MFTKIKNTFTKCGGVIDFITIYPKCSIFIAILVAMFLYSGYTLITDRIPAAVECWYKASWVDETPSDRWRFNFTPSSFENQCQRKRSDGLWVSYMKASDVGIESAEDLEN